jgi:hypothetical protein
LPFWRFPHDRWQAPCGPQRLAWARAPPARGSRVGGRRGGEGHDGGIVSCGALRPAVRSGSARAGCAPRHLGPLAIWCPVASVGRQADARSRSLPGFVFYHGREGVSRRRAEPPPPAGRPATARPAFSETLTTGGCTSALRRQGKGSTVCPAQPEEACAGAAPGPLADQKPRRMVREMPKRTPNWSREPAWVTGESAASSTRRS